MARNFCRVQKDGGHHARGSGHGEDHPHGDGSNQCPARVAGLVGLPSRAPVPRRNRFWSNCGSSRRLARLLEPLM